jgi:hypothetical protein
MGLKCGLNSSKSLALLISACKINKTLLVVMVEMEMKWVLFACDGMGLKCGLNSSKSLALLISACKINKTLLVVMVEMEMKWVL